jgi:hypothetical protein
MVVIVFYGNFALKGSFPFKVKEQKAKKSRKARSY